MRALAIALLLLATGCDPGCPSEEESDTYLAEMIKPHLATRPNRSDPKCYLGPSEHGVPHIFAEGCRLDPEEVNINLESLAARIAALEP